MRGAMTYAFVIERGPKSLWAQVPDLAVCVAAGESRAQVRGLMREAIELYIEELEGGGRRVRLRERTS